PRAQRRRERRDGSSERAGVLAAGGWSGTRRSVGRARAPARVPRAGGGRGSRCACRGCRPGTWQRAPRPRCRARARRRGLRPRRLRLGSGQHLLHDRLRARRRRTHEDARPLPDHRHGPLPRWGYRAPVRRYLPRPRRPPGGDRGPRASGGPDQAALGSGAHAAVVARDAGARAPPPADHDRPGSGTLGPPRPAHRVPARGAPVPRGAVSGRVRRALVLGVLVAGCGVSPDTTRVELRGYLARTRNWAPVEAEANRAIKRILATQFVDEAEIRRQIVDSRPRILTHLEHLRGYPPRSKDIARIHAR